MPTLAHLSSARHALGSIVNCAHAWSLSWPTQNAPTLQSPLGLLPKGGGGFQGAPHPRAVRVNPLKCGRTVDAVVDLLRAGAWKGVGKATQDAVRVCVCGGGGGRGGKRAAVQCPGMLPLPGP